MKKTSSPAMRSEYRLDYSKAKPNRFAAQMRTAKHAVVLDQDVSRVFKSSTEVNQALRALLKALPKSSTVAR